MPVLFELVFKEFFWVKDFWVLICIFNSVKAILLLETFLQVAFCLLHSVGKSRINMLSLLLSHSTTLTTQTKANLCGCQDYKQSKHHLLEQINRQETHRKVICNNCLWILNKAGQQKVKNILYGSTNHRPKVRIVIKLQQICKHFSRRKIKGSLPKPPQLHHPLLLGEYIGK